MKIKPEHYERLQGAILLCSNQIPPLDAYLASGNTARRWRWDLLWTATRNTPELMRGIYDYANDEHIDTALRRITTTR